MIRLLLSLLLAILAGCSKPVPVPSSWTPPAPGTIFDASGRELTDTDLRDLSGQADFILIGESHTNLCDHTIQARIIETLAASDRHFSIGLEMLPVTSQPVLDRFNAGAIPVDSLEREVLWARKWGYPFNQYKPVFELARQYNLPVVALNIPRETLETFKVSGRDGLSAAEQDMLPLQIIPPGPHQKKALAEQFALHQTMRRMAATGNATSASPSPGPDMTALEDAFFTTQSLWDTMMADQAIQRHRRTGQPVLILAGTGHVEHGWGIEYRLRTLAPTSRCLAVIPVRDAEDRQEQTAPELQALPGRHVFFFCPAQHRSRLGMNIVFGASMRIESVERDSRADQAGLRAGDMLLEAGGEKLKEATDLHFAAMKAARNNTPLQLTVQRGAATLTIDLNLR